MTQLMTADRRLVALRRLAWACALLMLVVTSASAWLRLAQPRPVCGDWPACRSVKHAPLSAAAQMGSPAAMQLARGTHRVAATVVLLSVLGLAALALARVPRRRAIIAPALGLVALALGLSVLGVFTTGSRASSVLLGNLLGGLLMLGLSWRLVRRLSDATPLNDVWARSAFVCALLWAAQAALGGLAGAGVSGIAPVAHAALALVVAPWAWAVGWAAYRQGRRFEAAALMVLVVLQCVLGIVAAGFDASPALVFIHNIGAALGLALLLGLP